MATLQTLNDGESGSSFRGKLNTNFSALNNDISTLDSNKLDSSDISTINGTNITSGGNLVIPALTDGDKGDIVVSGSGATWTVDNNSITNAKLGTTATNTFKGRTTAGTGNVEDLTMTQATAMLNQFSTSLKGLVPASGSSSTFLRGDGNWTNPIPSITGCRIKNSTNQTITPDLDQSLTYDTDEYDTNGYHTGSNSRFTIPTGKSGYYLIDVQIEASGPYSPYIVISGLLNGSTTVVGNQTTSLVAGASATKKMAHLHALQYLAAGDYIEFFYYMTNTSGNNMTAIATTTYASITLIAV